MGTIEFQGHRGARGLLPENTLPGFVKALTLGLSGIEFDVQCTKDGVVVVTHDFTLSPKLARLNGAFLKEEGSSIASQTYQELKKYDVGRINPLSPYAKKFPRQTPVDGAYIPTLDEVLALFDKKTIASIEIKSDGITPQEKLVEATLEVIDRYPVHARILSFDWEVLRYAKKMAPSIPTVYLTTSPPQAIKDAGGSFWSPHYLDLTDRAIEAADALNLPIIVWTVNDTAEMRALIARGVSGIVTDYPNVRLR